MLTKVSFHANYNRSRSWNCFEMTRSSLSKANRAKEVIERHYSELVRLKQERAERIRKINKLIDEEELTEEEKSKVAIEEVYYIQ